MEKVLVVWIEVQTSHSVPIGQSVTQIMALTLQFCGGWVVRRLLKKSLKLAEVGDSWGLMKEAISITQMHKVKPQVLIQKLQQVIQKI